MKEISVKGQKRTAIGKKASKELRKEGMVPCNLYGEKKDEKGLPEAFAFTASFSELRKAVYTPEVYVVNLDIDGQARSTSPSVRLMSPLPTSRFLRCSTSM